MGDIKEITAPDLGVDKAEVTEILVKVGDSVAADDGLMMVESEKASVEVPSSEAGEVAQILVSEGDEITQGMALVKLRMSASVGDSKQDSDIKAQEKAGEITSDANVQPESVNESRSVADQKSATAQTFKLPDLGVEEAQVSELLVKVGDAVSKDDALMLLESDKASVEVPSPADGEVTEVLVELGSTVQQGQAFVVIKTKGGATSAEATEAESNAGADKSGGYSAPQKQVADQKTSPQKTPSSKTLPQKRLPQAGTQTPATTHANESAKAVYAGPAVRKLCRELGVDITQVKGSSKNGRIIKDDVHEFVKHRMQHGQSTLAQQGASTSASLPPLPNMSGSEWGQTHTEKLSNLQKVSIPQLSLNTQLPQVTQFDLADITDTENYRASIKAELKKDGVSLTIVAFIIKAVAYALKQYPKFNSHLADDHQHLIMRDEVHLGIAVATDAGLIVPVLRHADKKGLKQIAEELGILAGKARDKRLGKADLTGAGFTISSQGNMGGTYFTPLVNHPQVAILGISEATMQPRWHAEKNTFEPRLMLPLSLSYDHRVINGADAAVFTRYLAKLLSDVRSLLL